MADTKARTAIWKGLNRMPYIADGEMRDMKNLSSDAYPFITTRKGRKPYTFTTYIPSPEGEAYKDTERLPAPCAEEAGNIYKITTDAPTSEYISGEFYYYDEASAAWVQGIKDSTFLGIADGVITVSGGQTLWSNNYYNNFSNYGNLGYTSANFGSLSYIKQIGCTVTNPSGTCSYYITRDRVRYIGEDVGIFKKGRYYAYKVYAEAYIVSTTASKDSDTENLFAPYPDWAYNDWVYRYYNTDETSDSITYSYIKPSGETTTETFSITHGGRFTARMRGYGYWEEIDAYDYKVVNSMPENPTDGMQVLFVNNKPQGAPELAQYYTGEKTLDENGNDVYFYTNPTSATGYTSVNFLPEASGENVGTTYIYTGLTTAGQFAECYYNNGAYAWRSVSHPKVARTVTLQDYLDNYDGSGLSEILEIGAFNGDIAALILDGSGNSQLYYDQKLWSVSNLSEEAGKKLITIGNRLVVGEAGSYLHIKDGVPEFFKSGGAFVRTITASYAPYGNGGEKAKWSSVYSNGSSTTFTIVASGGGGAGFEDVYNGLMVAGTDFKVTFNGKTYYMTVSSVTYKKNVNIAGWSVGDTWYYSYADVLEISATNSLEAPGWNNTGTGFSMNFTFESTDPHYSDVVAWKKRLWGYDENVMYGTVADIFDSYGIVDWNTGDNTYTEAISQPLWQGGDITGIAALMSGLLYFKEDCLTIVTGNYPAIMSSNTIPCRGLPPENRRSVTVAKECVYYLSTDGVYRYSGGIPECISREVKIKGTEAVGASDGNKYWLSLKEESGEYALYVYDINYGIWHKEDTTNAISFTMLNGEMYMAVGTEIYNLNAAQEEDGEWECELWYDEGTHHRKKYKQINIRGNVGECELFLKADDGEWRLIDTTEDKLHSKFIPFECEELSIKLRGKGVCEIKSIDRIFEVVK